MSRLNSRLLPPFPSLFRLTLALLILTLSIPSLAQNVQTWTATPFNMPSIPLAVKGPYVNVWEPQASGPAPLNRAWPSLWDFNIDTYGWYASVRVDGTSYYLMGYDTSANSSSASQTAVVVTPTRSSYLFNAGPVVVNMTFLSPVEPDDPVKMSTPFSYMYVTFATNSSGGSHSVQFYSDISGEWISGDDNLEMTWSGSNSGQFTLLQATLASPGAFQEVSGTTQDGTAYYAVQNSNDLSWEIAPNAPLRTTAAYTSALNNSADTSFHAVGSPFDVLGIMANLGTISSTSPSDPLVYVVGVVRDPVVQYTNDAVQLTIRSAYYVSEYSNVHDLIGAVLNNFTDALAAAEKLDAQLVGDGGALSGEYVDLLTLATRQTFGAVDLTVPTPESGAAVNKSDVKAFAKDFGGVGSGGVNAVDVLYAAMPAYLYLWPDLLGHLLRPLLEYQESTQYTNAYAAADLGAAYPNATGNFAGHRTQIEQCANMLIMALAHAQATGDGSLLKEHYALFDKWAAFLVENALAPGSNEFTSATDAIFASNQTNLALKGIVGIGAMSKIAGYASLPANASAYLQTAQQYAQQWVSLATTNEFIALSYGSGNSGLIYNLYADKLTQTNLIPSSVYDLQTSYYKSALSQNSYGIPLDMSNPTLTRSDWMLFAAASVTDNSVRDSLIHQVHSYASAGNGNMPFAVVYNPSNGTQLTSNSNSGGNGGMASFAQGAMFAPLALNVPIRAVSFTNGQPSSKKKINIGAIVGAVVGGLVVLGAIIGGVLYFMRRRESPAKGMYNRADRIERERTKPLDHALIEPYDEMADLGNGVGAEWHYTDSPSATGVGMGVRSSDSLLDSRVSGLGGPGRHAPGESIGGIRTFGGPSISGRPSLTPRSRTDSTGLNSTLVVQNVPSEASFSGAASSAGGTDRTSTLIGSATGVSGYSQRPGKEKGAPDALASEVAELRREIARMRDSHADAGEMLPPPSYDEDVYLATAAQASGSQAGDDVPVMRQPRDVKKRL